MLKNGYVKIATIVPEVFIADPQKNVENICNLFEKCNNLENPNIFVTPELSITGYTCADLFYQNQLYKELENAIRVIKEFTAKPEYEGKLFVLGTPIKINTQIFNCALYIQNGSILCVVPKTNISNEEQRWFTSAINKKTNVVEIDKQSIPFSEKILLKDKESNLVIGTDICEDIWLPISPSTLHCLNGANLILNLSATPALAGKTEIIKNIITMNSIKNHCGYIYVNAGPTESTADVVYDGQILISDGKTLIVDNKITNNYCVATIDIDKIQNNKVESNITINYIDVNYEPIYIDFETGYETHKMENITPYPFVPSDNNKKRERCIEILNIQAQALATRLEKTDIKKAVIGISGGSDSTLALLVIKKAFEINNLPMENIIGITMPGFGTSNRTLTNSLELMKEIGTTIKNISIVPACNQHLKDINQPEDVFDITFENAQARERTQILFDIANKENGLVIGTGDLSELALGWCTYNGDHMSNYSVNADVPKTLVKSLIQISADIFKENGNKKLFEILYSIIETPISPELLPLNEKGEIKQKTEKSIGKYDLHDFFLYHYIKNKFEHEKILELAYQAFPQITTEEIESTFKTFIRRFTTQQFKRNCVPDGPKVGTISLNPRGDFKMPSDIIYRKK